MTAAEEADRETGDADLVQLNDELNKLSEENDELSKRLDKIIRDKQVLERSEFDLREHLGHSREAHNRIAVLAAITLVLLFTFIAMPRSEPDPVMCPPPPACPEVVTAPPGPPMSGTAVEGYFVDTELGLVRVPWPDASRYNAETFMADCQAVCEVPAATHREAGRVLTADPAHLVCVCFHPDSSWPVTRWINWERVR